MKGTWAKLGDLEIKWKRLGPSNLEKKNCVNDRILLLINFLKKIHIYIYIHKKEKEIDSLLGLIKRRSSNDNYITYNCTSPTSCFPGSNSDKGSESRLD